MDITSGLAPAIELLSPEYQGYAIWLLGMVASAYTLYTLVIKPLMAASAKTKELLQSRAENDSLKEAMTMTQQEMETMINGTFSKADILMIESKIVELKVKLPFADEAGKTLLLTEIAKLEASLV